MGSLRRLMVVVGASVLLALSSSAPAQLLPDPDARKAADKCQREVKKAAMRFATQELKLLDTCTSRVASCVQTKPGDGRCLDKAEKRCARDLDKIAAEQGRLGAQIEKKCARLSAEDLLRDIGVGWVLAVPACLDDVGIEVVDVATAAACLAGQHACAVERLFTLERPRAGELLRLVGLTLGPGSCLQDFGGDGESVGDRALGKTVERCARIVAKASRIFAVRKLASLAACVDAVFTCVQLKPGDQSCVPKARDTCDKAFARIDGEAAKLDFRIDRNCRNLDFAVARAPSGASLDDLLAECLTVGIDGLGALNDYQNCVERRHQCVVDEMMPFEAPRAQELLGRVGRGLPTTPFCPTVD